MSLIVLNQASLVKFMPRLQPGGVLVVNTSLVDMSQVQDQEINVAAVPANDIADELGSVKMANIVALGAWVQATEALPLDNVREVVASLFASKGEKLVQANDQALIRGSQWVSQVGSPVLE